MVRNDCDRVTHLIAQHAASLSFEALPRELVELIKLSGVRAQTAMRAIRLYARIARIIWQNMIDR